jgi:hypothetical protein
MWILLIVQLADQTQTDTMASLRPTPDIADAILVHQAPAIPEDVTQLIPHLKEMYSKLLVAQSQQGHDLRQHAAELTEQRTVINGLRQAYSSVLSDLQIQKDITEKLRRANEVLENTVVKQCKVSNDLHNTCVDIAEKLADVCTSCGEATETLQSVENSNYGHTHTDNNESIAHAADEDARQSVVQQGDTDPPVKSGVDTQSYK